MNKISTRQLFFFLACVAPVGKLVVMPARLSEYVGNDLLLPPLLHYLLQSAAIFCVLLLAKREMSLFELLKNSLGKVLAAIIVLLLSLFLCFAALQPLLEQKLFVQGTFYDTIPSFVAFAPFFLMSVYLCSKPLGSSGRVWDIIAPVAALGLLGILVFSVTTAKYAAILPVAGSGARKLLKGAVYTFSWFFDSTILLLFLGKIEYKKGTAWKGALFYLLGGLAVLFFLATFYGIFEETAINQLFAFTNTSKFFAGITVLGRVDFIFIYALALVMVFYCALPLHAGIEGALQVFGRKKYLPTLLSIGVNLIMFFLVLSFDFMFGSVSDFISQKGFWLYPVFALGIPALFLLLRRKKNESS